MLVPARAHASRRAALTGALAGLTTLAACDLDPSSTSSGPGPDPHPVADPDAVLVDAVRAELRGLAVLVSAVRSTHPALREPLAGLRELHLAHLEALGDRSVPPVGPGAPAAGGARALSLVRSRERRAQGRLADWSVAARSGALARLLASMSAGTAQHLAALPAALPTAAVAR